MGKRMRESQPTVEKKGTNLDQWYDGNAYVCWLYCTPSFILKYRFRQKLDHFRPPCYYCVQNVGAFVSVSSLVACCNW